MQKILDIARKFGIPESNLELYGNYKAKLDLTYLKPKGKLILVTAINPTPAGEGKTTISIGLTDSLNSIGHKTALAVREPSLGPVFGMKGGATGSNNAQIIPSEDINLHFNGDFHAITSANNLIAAIIDNHIYWGNSLNIKEVVWKRCLDMNDRSLRDLNLTIKKNISRQDHFQITAASEIMAVLALSESINDLEERLNKLIIGINEKDEPIYLNSFGVTGSVLALLKDAIKPNLVQTKEGNPVFVHCGPFANIAHGCNSIIATKTSLSLFEYTVTEAGFGADLGMEKFLDLKCRSANLWPDAVVIVATIKALKMHGNKPLDRLQEVDIPALQKGLELLEKHISNVKKFNLNYVVTLNHFNGDSQEEISFVTDWAKAKEHSFAFADVWDKGSDGGQDLANLIVQATNKPRNEPIYIYDEKDSIELKINKIAKEIYGAESVDFSSLALSKIQYFKSHNLTNKYVCMAKTPASLSDDPKLLGVPENWTLKVQDLAVSNGAGFIIAYCGSVMTMPGLPKLPAALNITVENGEVKGLE